MEELTLPIYLFFYISVVTWIPILFNEIIIYTIIIYFGAHCHSFG